MPKFFVGYLHRVFEFCTVPIDFAILPYYTPKIQTILLNMWENPLFFKVFADFED